MPGHEPTTAYNPVGGGNCSAHFADSANAVAYVPLLNVCAAIQTGLFFSINNHRKSYIGIFVVLAAYAALYCWNV